MQCYVLSLWPTVYSVRSVKLYLGLILTQSLLSRVYRLVVCLYLRPILIQSLWSGIICLGREARFEANSHSEPLVQRVVTGRRSMCEADSDSELLVQSIMDGLDVYI